MQVLSKREAKKVKLYMEIPDHEKSKEFKKSRKFLKSCQKEEARRKNWLRIFEGNEDDEGLRAFEKIRRSPAGCRPCPSSSGRTREEGGIFSRPAPHYGRNGEKSLASGVDQLVTVSSIKSPPLKKGLIDRFLAVAEKNGFDILICINKIDLAERDDHMAGLGLYEHLGYRVLFTSARLNIGIEELRASLKDRRSLFIGHSGVGKSSLLNAIDPQLNLKVGEVSASSNKGTHTTRSTRLIKLTSGGEVFDCPGFRQFGLLDVSRAELPNLFREFRDAAKLCRFPDCSHIEEEGCAVKKAVEGGAIGRERYESYLRIYGSLG